MKIYRVEIESDNFEIIMAENEENAIKRYFNMGNEHELFNLIELDDDYNELKIIL